MALLQASDKHLVPNLPCGRGDAETRRATFLQWCRRLFCRTVPPFGVASRYAAVKSRPPACKSALWRSVSFAFSFDVARRYAEQGVWILSCP
ncbi:MAG: hypothetical protein LBR08_02840 [Bacteroidales bacterium]|nr:hypothetical protein [Bacteroidales bacterium]